MQEVLLLDCFLRVSQAMEVSSTTMMISKESMDGVEANEDAW